MAFVSCYCPDHSIVSPLYNEMFSGQYSGIINRYLEELSVTSVTFMYI
jgi:hypothetical protein